jgi:hypothetical protein
VIAGLFPRLKTSHEKQFIHHLKSLLLVLYSVVNKKNCTNTPFSAQPLFDALEAF